MPLRLIALALLLAVLPTAEVVEQAVHVVQHALGDDGGAHTAHHDGTQGEEHGCTGLVHLCGCHHTQVTVTAIARVTPAGESVASVASRLPPRLIDLSFPEPPHRPPIG